MNDAPEEGSYANFTTSSNGGMPCPTASAMPARSHRLVRGCSIVVMPHCCSLAFASPRLVPTLLRSRELRSTRPPSRPPRQPPQRQQHRSQLPFMPVIGTDRASRVANSAGPFDPST